MKSENRDSTVQVIKLSQLKNLIPSRKVNKVTDLRLRITQICGSKPRQDFLLLQSPASHPMEMGFLESSEKTLTLFYSKTRNRIIQLFHYNFARARQVLNVFLFHIKDSPVLLNHTTFIFYVDKPYKLDCHVISYTDDNVYLLYKCFCKNYTF